jgi:hypothetical protein
MQRDARRRASASTPGARRVEFGAYEGTTACVALALRESRSVALCASALMWLLLVQR